MSVVSLHRDHPANDVVGSLRRLADEIEAGEHGDWPVTTCVVMLGHTDGERPVEDEQIEQRAYWDTRCFGIRSGVFTVRGLIASVMRKWGSE